jgi:hypothetical protein
VNGDVRYASDSGAAADIVEVADARLFRTAKKDCHSWAAA